MLITLWGFEGLGLIIPMKSGVTYRNQVAGTGCLEMRLEGVFAPLPVRWLNTQQDVYTDLYKAKTHPEGSLQMFQNMGLDQYIERDLSAESIHEAWIPVIIKNHAMLRGFNGHKAILTYENSD